MVLTVLPFLAAHAETRNDSHFPQIGAFDRRRLYFMLPNLAVTKAVVNALLLEHIDDHHMHVLANDHTHHR